MNVKSGGKQPTEVYENEKYKHEDGLENQNVYTNKVQQNISISKAPFEKRSYRKR